MSKRLGPHRRHKKTPRPFAVPTIIEVRQMRRDRKRRKVA